MRCSHAEFYFFFLPLLVVVVVLLLPTTTTSSTTTSMVGSSFQFQSFTFPLMVQVFKFEEISLVTSIWVLTQQITLICA
jgi:hypothetical protein